MAVSLNIIPKEEEGDICGICHKQFAKYTCPKCNIRYCSITCYKAKKHIDCSERFYKDCIMEELKQQKGVSTEEQRKMMNILKQFEETDSKQQQQMEEEEEEEECKEENEKEENIEQENEEEEDEEENEEEEEEEQGKESLESRLKGINLDADPDPDQIWERLTEEERREFHTMLQSGALAEMVEDNTPWWQRIPRIQPLDSQNGQDFIPSLPSHISPLSSLIKNGRVSSCLPYNILNVLYGYVFTVRLFNCEHNKDPLQSVQVLFKISSVLSQDLSFNTVQDALQHAIAIVNTDPDLSSSQHYSLSIINDVISLVERRSVVSGCVLGVHGLSDVCNMIVEAKKLSKKGTDENMSKKRLFSVNMKVQFLLSWCLERGFSELSPLARSIHLEHESFTRTLKDQCDSIKKTHNILTHNIMRTSDKQLIQELN